MRRVKRGLLWLTAAALLLALSGCRRRTTGSGEGEEAERAVYAAAADDTAAGERLSESAAFSVAGGDGGADGQGASLTEDPDAKRRVYDAEAQAEIEPGADRALHLDGEGDGTPAAGKQSAESADRVADGAERTAKQTVSAEEAERKRVSEDAEAADSARTYYTVLLEERLGSLFECKRLTAYLEMPQDHVTVFKTSAEHGLLLEAGVYDASSRLLAENLRVDDGWVTRKNPGVIVKFVDGETLGRGAVSAAGAQAVWRGLLSRDGWNGIDAVRSGRVVLLSEELLGGPCLKTAAEVIIAKCAYPELFADVDAQEALQMLVQEETGGKASGLWFYPAAE